MSYPGKSVFVCLLLVVACVCLQAHWGEPARRPLDKMEELHGEAAIRQLKTDGGYASLAAAMAAARYQINAAPTNASRSGAPFYANNPGQQLRATFASDEVCVSDASSNTPDKASSKTDGKAGGTELRLQLAGYGYGDHLEPLAKGVLTANGDRITIRKSTIRHPQSAIEEWYVNKPEGLEHGFTLAAPPEGTRRGKLLRVAVTVGAPGSDWRVSLRGDGQGALFERQADGLRFSYDHLMAYDAQGRTLPARMELEGATLKLLVNDTQAAYPLTIDPIITQQRKLTAADAAALDQFGYSVALSGNTAVVGVPSDDAGDNANQGSVHVFVRNGTRWSLQKKLTANDGAAFNRFGTSLSLIGDTLAVGAPYANMNRGAVYIFTRGDNTWTQQPRLTAYDGADSDFFGTSVSISNDTLVVGAYFADINGKADQGAAYVFTRNGTVWAPHQKLVAHDGESFNQFGGSVALSGQTIVVGAEGVGINGNENQGGAYVFTRSGNTWTQQQKLSAGDGAAGDNFGCSVAISGNTVAVGANMNDFGQNSVDQGSVYLFTRTGTNWLPQQQLLAASGRAFDRFGQHVALSGDTLVVGATGNDVGGFFDQGSAHVFARSGATWSEQRNLFADAEAVRAQPATPGGITPGAEFGSAVALSGDTVLVGAPNENGTFMGQGAAYVFVIGTNNHVQQQPLTANDGAASDFFGRSIALSGDTVVVGADNDDIGANLEQGSAYVFTRSGTTWTPQQKLTATDGAADDFFGNSVTLSGDTVVVGAVRDDMDTKVDQGSAYVFIRSGTTWTQQQKLTAADGVGHDDFGISVALSGDTVVVGASDAKIGANTNQGSAYVFTRSGSVWTQQQKLTANDGAALDQFGFSVALSGDTVVVGAASDDIGANTNQGSAYVFTRSGTNWTPQQKLTANDGAAGDVFGFSVALSGDTVVLSAIGDDIGANANQGSAYVFTRSGATWAQQQRLTANDGAANDDFGHSVALSGDTVVVGSDRDDIGVNTDQGSAYVFTRGGLVWTQQQKLTAADGSANENFGYAVALSGDTVVVSAITKTIGTNVKQGAAYVFISPACPVITLTPDSLPGARVGDPYSQIVRASGGTGPYQFSLSDGTLPPGLILEQNGQLSGTPTMSGTYRFTITATILGSLCPGSRSYTLTVSNDSCPTLVINPPNFPMGQSGVVYGQTLAASGGTEPYSFTLSAGALPTGLTLFSLPGGGMLTGTPTVTGNFNFTILATDANGCQGTRAYTLTISPPCPAITINPVSLPNGTVGVAYSQTLTATGGASPYTFTVSAGNLPAGLSLSANGALTGTPTVAGSFNCVVRATDMNGCQGTRTYPVTINRDAARLQFYPLAHPVRLLDTRVGGSGCDAPGAKITGGTSRHQTAAGRTCDGLTIPANAAALVGNGTTVQSGGGYFTLYSSDIAKPNSANSNYATNQILNSLFTVRLGATDGAFKIFVSTDTDIVVDVTGYYAPPSASGLYFHPLPKPVRLLDTRPGASACFTPGAALQGDSATSQIGTTTCDGVLIPAGAQALVGNATTVSPQANGFLTLYPADAARPLIASANFQPGVNLNSPFMVGLSPSGQFNMYVASTTDLVVDVTGYYSTQLNDANGLGLLFSALAAPKRLLDTRAGQPGCFTPGAQMIGGAIYPQLVMGACTNVPALAQAVVGNATTINVSANGFLTFWPSGANQPFVATSNYRSGQIFNRHFTVGLGADGTFERFASSTTDLVVDLVGYFAP